MHDDGPPGRRSLPGADAVPSGALLHEYLTAQAAEFLRRLPRLREEPAGLAAMLVTMRRIDSCLTAFSALFDHLWAQGLRDELDEMSAALSQEERTASRLGRLLQGLDRLSGTVPVGADQRHAGHPGHGSAAAGLDGVALVGEPVDSGGRGAWGERGGATAPLVPAARRSGRRAGTAPEPSQGGPVVGLADHPGVPKARILLTRRSGVTRERAHTDSLRLMHSERFHALADRMAMLTTDVPFTPAADLPARSALLPLIAEAHRKLVAQVGLLPLGDAATPYNGQGLTPAHQDADWRRTHLLAERCLDAAEACRPAFGGSLADLCRALGALTRLLELHRQAVDAAEAAALAARAPRITPETAYALGVLHADQRRDVERARYAFGLLWPDVAAADWLHWEFPDATRR
ncbi:CHAD domain-containing protein [Allostreptomyces psammosilenae]|uniref:CHAD domain-containing protein n=1 Tax=Allostreptomyces psammosilenae TaxID=1892865 RepID=A0A853A227_9ACTN|nr:CHAD domain-containing protein [Allostreptomyces psammosilenae]NYI07510.1 hypothetical protein [Allostreptomyces psammosilenae]